jgi:AAA domain
VQRAPNEASARSGEEGQDGGDSHRKLIVTPAADIRPRRVRWLWKERLALGTLGLLAGREGLGKSTVAYWMTGQITRGTLPGEYQGQPRAVLVCATEDSWEHTIVPRLIAHNADLSRVYRVEMLSDAVHVSLSLPRDLPVVSKAATDKQAALMVLDPLLSRPGTAVVLAQFPPGGEKRGDRHLVPGALFTAVADERGHGETRSCRAMMASAEATG